jgi:PGF-pre-PGF domain-containing protein
MERVHPDAYREYETGADPDDSDSGSDDDRDSRSDDRGSASSQAAGTTPTAGTDRANRTRLRTTGNATLALSEPEGDDAIGVEIENASAGETVTVDVAGDAVRNRTRTSGWAIERLNVTFGTGTDTTIRIDSTNTTGVRTPVTNGSSTDPVDNASVIGYLNVSHTVGDGRISGGEIVVRTNRSVLEDRRSDGIALYRYHDETWARLNTTALGDGRFTARTPGFSTFAIVVDDANASRAAATTTPTPTGSPAVTPAPTTAPEATSTPTASPARTPAGTTAQRRATPRGETTGAEGPGFGLGVAVLVLALLTALTARRSD